MTFEPGRPIHLPKDDASFTRLLVDALVHIHAGGPPSSPGHRDQEARLDAHLQEESPRRNGVDVDPLLWSHIRRLWPSVERRPPTLIHDDYHPGNVPVPDRPFWELLSATRAVGIADAWYDSWVDFGVPGVTLPLVEERLGSYVARALSQT